MQIAPVPKPPTPAPIQPVSVPKSRTPVTPVVTLPGQGGKDKGFPADPDLEPENEPGSSSNDPPSVPGLPVTEGEFPIIHETPAPSDQVPIPETGSDSDSDATVDYREHQSSLLTLVEGDEDILIELPFDFKVPNLVPLDGDGFASWLTRQDKVKAGTVTPEMQRRYAKEIRLAKLDEFKSYLDNGALRLADKRKLSRDVNFLTGHWVLTVKVDKNRFFSKFKAKWVCRGFQDKHAWEQQTDSPTATRYGFRLVAQCAAKGEHYNTESRSVIIELPSDIGLPPWMVGVCLRPVYGLNDAPRRWWNRLGKFLVHAPIDALMWAIRARRHKSLSLKRLGVYKKKALLLERNLLCTAQTQAPALKAASLPPTSCWVSLVVWPTRREVGSHMRMDKLLCHTGPRHSEALNQHSR